MKLRPAALAAALLASSLAFSQQPATPSQATSPKDKGAESLPWAVARDGKVTPIHVGTATPATPAPAGLYVALGDSITHGVGVKNNCASFPATPVDIEAFCPEGTSYAILTAKALRAAGVAGRFLNLGISGAHVERVISDELPFLPADATLVTLYIGTNDSRGVKNLKTPIADVVHQYEQHFEDLLAAIHKQAPHARIVLINFPNQKYLAASYHLPDEVLPRYDATSQILDKFIDAHYPQYAVADTVCSPATYDDSLLYKSTVHPNEAGAAILADALVKVILAPKPPAPPAQCKWFDAATADALINRP
jgi:lysophospholipase L1-like esterase